jgi:chorismate mutase/prephenate dehydratase
MSLEEDRKAIDAIDSQILKLLNERARLAKKIAEQRGYAFDPARERQILDRLSELNTGPLPSKAVRNIYHDVLASMRALLRPPIVSYLGPEGSFNHLAALQHFSDLAEFIGAQTIDDAFLLVESGRADFGVVPIENSTEGVVRPTLDRLAESALKICAELHLDVVHNLMSRGNLESVKRIYSVPQALSQCRTWLRQNLPNAEVIEVTSTAKAAQIAAEQEGSAAIGSQAAAELYGLKILCEAVQDIPVNRTRFLVVSPEGACPSGTDKTSILFSVKHEPGALHKALSALSLAHINMTMIESRPTKKAPWEYMFFVDFQGHKDDPRVVEALKKMERRCIFLRVLGSYAEAD